MKIKLADGTEVEVADTDPIAIAARESQKAEGLGFGSLEEYHNSLTSEVDRLKNQTASDSEFINRQKNELGELRKLKPAEEKEPEKETMKESDKQEETPDQREARYAELNQGVQGNLTDEQAKFANEQFVKQYNDSTPQERALLKTEEGRNAFLGLVFPDDQTSETPISLFTPKAKPSLTIGEQVKQALSNDDKGRGRKPVYSAANGTGFVEGRLAPEHKKRIVTPLNVGGGLLHALERIESQNK